MGLFKFSVTFFFLFLCSQAIADFSFFSNPTPLPDTSKKTLLIAVAPFIPKSPVKAFQKDPGREFQHKIAA